MTNSLTCDQQLYVVRKATWFDCMVIGLTTEYCRLPQTYCRL